MFVHYLSVCDLNGENAVLSAFSGVRGLSEVKLTSKKFDDFKSCTDTAKSLIHEFAKELNQHYPDKDFVVETESNPKFDPSNSVTGTGILSSWGNHELTRFYVIDQAANEADHVSKILISVVSIATTKKGN